MASLSKADRPLFLVIGGPNGSGKSTSYERAANFLGGRTIWIVNPDRLTSRIAKVEGLAQADANLAAVQRLERWLESSLDVHKSIGVETVLSTDKYRRLVEKARTLNFDIGLIYVLLESPDLNVARVRSRVRKGGHDVPESSIRRRYYRSLTQLPWFLEAADFAAIYDNSGASMEQVGTKVQGVLTLDPSAPPVLLDALTTDL